MNANKPNVTGSHYVKESQFRIIIFRLLVIICLIITGGVYSAAGYIILNNIESQKFYDQYDSFADSMHLSIMNDLNARAAAGETFTTAYIIQCPKETDWPNCWIPYDVWEKLVDRLANTLNIRSCAMAPLVTTQNLASFEKFAYETYANESFPNTTGVSAFGKGVFAYDDSSNISGYRYHVTNGYTPNSSHDIIIPSFQSRKSQSATVMYNLHSTRHQAIDKLIECYEKDINCKYSSMSDLVQLITDIRPRPASILLNAITLQALKKTRTNSIVGFTTIVINWDSIFEHSAPSVVTGIRVVLSCGYVHHTFEFVNTSVVYIGPGDLHNTKYDHLKRQYNINADNTIYLNNYTISFYPQEQFYNSYHTRIPLLVCISVVAIVVLTSIIFAIYDYLVKRESIENILLLDGKRAYVRFVSHEIRTPLNIVSLGMHLVLSIINEILKEDVGELLQDTNNNSSSNHAIDKIREKLNEALSLIEDVEESSSSAICVLNDLINYDKIETHAFKFDIKLVEPIPLIVLSERTLQVQAKQSHVNLIYNAPFSDISSSLNDVQTKNMYLVGDSVKLGQVIRNIVSNALKFSNRDSQVIVTGKSSYIIYSIMCNLFSIL
jgi:signal transduction histidine kinase